MLLTPLLLVATDRWWIPRLARGTRSEMAELSETQSAPVIVAGFGRYGQVVSRMLYANGITPTVLDHDAEQIEALRKFGWRVFYGDATRLDLLRTAGAASARVLVLAIDDVEQNLKVAKLVREHFPQLAIVARARNVQHYLRLRELGVTLVERETLDSSLMSARSVLGLLGWEPHHARTLAMRFRRHTIRQLEAMLPHLKDEARFIAMASRGGNNSKTSSRRNARARSAPATKAGATSRPASVERRGDAPQRCPPAAASRRSGPCPPAPSGSTPSTGRRSWRSGDLARVVEGETRAPRKNLAGVAMTEIAMPRETGFNHKLCADMQGFCLHAAVRCDADGARRCEQLCRCIARPALANERVQCNAAGRVVLKLKKPWRDGTTHLVLSPLEFMQRLAALV